MPGFSLFLIVSLLISVGESAVPAICKQPLIQGTEGLFGFSFRFWHNPASGSCEQFVYFGGGNENNFATQSLCEQSCKQTSTRTDPISAQLSCPSPGIPLLNSTHQPQFCGGRNPRCPTGYTCRSSHSVFICCPTKATICDTEPRQEAGVDCGLRDTRWGYDPLTKACVTFGYLGCGGVGNNFLSRPECEKYCIGTVSEENAGCDGGACAANGVCPVGYGCNPMNICCRGAIAEGDFCPPYETQLIRYGKPKPCLPVFKDICPTKAECVPAPTKKAYFCCQK